MGGNAGIRGYIIQTFIGVLDAFKEENNWVSITLEPKEESEKVDIRWKYSNGAVKFCQVKSSQNLIRYSSAKKWCNELTGNSSNATFYELSLIGNVDEKLSKSKEIDGVRISDIKPLNVQVLIDQASTKIDKYYESKNKSKISSKVRELMISAMTSKFATSSIVGKEISRFDFDKELLSWISAVENQIEINPFASLAPPVKNKNKPINERIAKKILNLIGWNQFSENHTITIYNEKTEDDVHHSLEFYGDLESRLKDESGDFIMVNSLHSLIYPETTKDIITNYLYDLDCILNDFQKNKTIPLNGFEETDVYAILFWLSTDNREVSTNFVHTIKGHFKQKNLNEKITYLVVDNKKANFLISSIVTAKNYREGLSVKFLYPITEENQSPGKIGGRGLKLPPQFINSSILPIVKEDKSKISFLLFCSDPFSKDTLEKLIWLTISLTSGFGNEYLLYFSDYEDIKHKNTASKVIRSFREESLDEKIQIHKYDNIDAEALDSLSNISSKINRNESYNEEELSFSKNIKHLNKAFENILPYGDLLKPFLKTDAINPNDIKYFLAKKGIFYKYANKDKLIGIMTSLLFSPKELEDFKSYIELKERTTKSTEVLFKIKNQKQLSSVVKDIKLDIDELTKGLSISVANQDNILFEQTDKQNEYKLTLVTELKDPTESLLVNTRPGKSEVVIKMEDNKLIVVTENTISKEDKHLANRIAKQVEKDLQRVGFIEKEKIKVLFSMFSSNSERVNFLLSFTNISSSTLFKEADIQSIKFKFDEDTTIPDRYKDKIDKDLVISYDGTGLQTLQELSENNAKYLIYLEEMKITYKFSYLNVRKGTYKVTYNFSNALKNKPKFDGIFKSEPYLIKSKPIKELSNIKGLEKILADEIEQLKLNKLKQFDIIE